MNSLWSKLKCFDYGKVKNSAVLTYVFMVSYVYIIHTQVCSHLFNINYYGTLIITINYEIMLIKYLIHNHDLSVDATAGNQDEI